MVGRVSKSRYAKLGEYLRLARIRKNLSQGEVSAALGYSSPQFISNIERGLCSPPLKSLKTLIELYNLNKRQLIDVIFQEEERILSQNIAKLKKNLGA